MTQVGSSLSRQGRSLGTVNRCALAINASSSASGIEKALICEIYSTSSGHITEDSMFSPTTYRQANMPGRVSSYVHTATWNANKNVPVRMRLLGQWKMISCVSPDKEICRRSWSGLQKLCAHYAVWLLMQVVDSILDGTDMSSCGPK